MNSDILNADRGITSGFGYSETKRVALRAVDQMRGASGGTIYVPMGYHVAGVVDVEISTAANGLGAARISQEGSALPLQSVGSNLFLMSTVQDNSSVGQVRFNVGFPKTTPARRRLKGRVASYALIPKA